MKYLMACGCVNIAVTSDGKPACPIHDCLEIKREIVSPTEGLEGRKARCSYHCGSESESKWTLPFFKYKPNEQYDEYYCGCFGWD